MTSLTIRLKSIEFDCNDGLEGVVPESVTQHVDGLTCRALIIYRSHSQKGLVVPSTDEVRYQSRHDVFTSQERTARIAQCCDSYLVACVPLFLNGKDFKTQCIDFFFTDSHGTLCSLNFTEAKGVRKEIRTCGNDREMTVDSSL